MSLSRPAPRKHIHTRRIECQGFQRDDGHWDIEGTLTDSKTYSFDNVDRGGVASGEAVHRMTIRLTVNADRSEERRGGEGWGIRWSRQLCMNKVKVISISVLSSSDLFM